MSAMKIAVTGASGFIGRYVLAELARQQVEVVAVTRNTTRLAGSNLAARVVEMDMTAPGADCFDRLGRPDVLIHLAWDGLPNYKSLHHFETELPRQFRFLKSMVEAGLPSLLVTGTCFEYGMQSGALPEDLLTQPTNPYGHAKDALRRQLEFLKQVKPFNLTWARLFYMFGEGQPKSSLYPQLKDAVQRGERVFNMSGGEQLRDYLAIDEVARLISSLASLQGDAGCVNVCAGKPVSVRKLVEGWIEENGWAIELNLGHYPYPDYEPMAFWGDRRRLDAILE
jgi:nucleoside-diphosphate-sugar epimerase